MVALKKRDSTVQSESFVSPTIFQFPSENIETAFLLSATYLQVAPPMCHIPTF